MLNDRYYKFAATNWLPVRYANAGAYITHDTRRPFHR
jgi:hypothetical protein